MKNITNIGCCQNGNASNEFDVTFTSINACKKWFNNLENIDSWYLPVVEYDDGTVAQVFSL